MKLPNGDRAIVELSKLRHYCLNPHHEHGKHKARVFSATLGLRARNAEWLREQLLRFAVEGDATAISQTQFGALYMLDCELKTDIGATTVRSGWIVRHNEDFPRLVTCYIKRKT